MAGIMLGCALATPIGRCGGRRLGIKLMGVIALVGIVVQITASVQGFRYWQLVAGKVINSISMGCVEFSSPSPSSSLVFR